MLNRAARYFPILREIRRQIGGNASLLEVGSGPTGIGEFWPHRFVGCDISFPFRPVPPLMPVICSGAQLPFGDRSFDCVVASDVMEHVPPEKRIEVIREVLRVARKVAVFGFPCGPRAFALDRKLREEYQTRQLPVPVWLEEHMLAPFPEEDLFQVVPAAWNKKVLANESLRFHYWMMRREMWFPVNVFFWLCLRFMPRPVEWLLRKADEEPSYRKIFILSRAEEGATS